MRYWVYDEDGVLFRKFWDRHTALRLLQPGWKLIVQPKQQEARPTSDTHGEARW